MKYFVLNYELKRKTITLFKIDKLKKQSKLLIDEQVNFLAFQKFKLRVDGKHKSVTDVRKR